MGLLQPRTAKLLLVGTVLFGAAAAGVLLGTYTSTANSAPLRTTESLPADAATAAVASDGAAAGGSAAAPESSYAVTLSPVGTVWFTRPPERIVTQDDNYNDMVVTVGRGSKLVASGFPQNVFDGYYDQLPGVARGFDPRAIRYLSGTAGAQFDKELLYELRAEVHHIDPLQLARARGWTPADVEEIARNVGPFFANRFSRENSYDGPEPYEYYSVFELAQKVAEVYQEADRIGRLRAIHDAMVERIQAKLPPRAARPRVALVYCNGRRFTAYSMRAGFDQEQYRAVGAVDAFEATGISTYGDASRGAAGLDLEGLLAVDPDVIIQTFAVYGAPGSGEGGRAAYEQLLQLRDDPLGKRLKAFRNEQVFPGGTPLQGPVFYVFQVEMAAKQIYPHLFGRYRDDQAYPREEWLFDREAVARILRGEPAGEQ